MVEIPEKEQLHYPNPHGGFYDKKVDTDKSELFDKFVTGMSYVNDLLKKETDGDSK